MENKKQITQNQNVLQHDLQRYSLSEEYHHIVAIYFETALANFYRTTKNVMRRVGIDLKGLSQDNDLGKYLTDCAKKTEYLSSTQLANLSQLLYRHMPFFGPLMANAVNHEIYLQKKDDESNNKEKEKNILAGVSAAKQLEYLADMAHAMIFYRNCYSHKKHYETEADKEAQKKREQLIALWMEMIFKAERNLIITRKNHNTEDVKFLTNNADNHYYKEIGRNYDFYFSPAKKENGIWQMTDFGRFFFCQLFLQKRDMVRFADDTLLFDNSPFLNNEDDLIALQAAEDARATREQLVANISNPGNKVNPHIFKKNESVQNNIIRAMLDIYRVRIPREKRIDITQTKSTLIMDALNELRRCPIELYDTFSPIDKASFIVKSVDPNGNEVVNKLTRSQDRFPELALRFIDEEEMLGNIRFHMRLGLFRYRFYDKQLVDGSKATPIRAVHKEVNGFGRWQDVELMRNKKFSHNSEEQGPKFQKRELNDIDIEQPIPDNADTQPYITDWRTTYNIHAQRIGLAWGLEKMNDQGVYIPDLVTDNDDNRTRKALLEMPAPMCYLSVYDLPALLFYYHLHQKYIPKDTKSSPEQIIKQKYQAIRDYITYVSEGHSDNELQKKLNELKLNESETPSRLTENNRIFNHVNNLLDEIIRKADYCLHSFKKRHDKIAAGGRSNNYGRKGSTKIRYVSLARYLVDSMMRWQPALQQAGGGKLTSVNHKALVFFLAEYGLHGEDTSILENVLTNAGLLNSKNPHPFLKGVVNNKPANIESLYVEYLNAEIEHAKKIKSTIIPKKDRGAVFSELSPFFHTNSKYGSRDHCQLANRYLHTPVAPYDRINANKCFDAPIMLPDGLFTDAIITLIKDKGENVAELKQMKELLEHPKDKNKSYGAAYLIRYWFQMEREKKNSNGDVMIEKGASQRFYGTIGEYKRFYKAVSMLDPQRKKNRQLIPDYFTEDVIANKVNAALKWNDSKWKELINKVNPPKKGESIIAKVNSLKTKLKKVRHNEQLIRRYRIQDIALFLTAREVLVNLLSEGDDEFGKASSSQKKEAAFKAATLKLENFGFSNELAFLRGDENKPGLTYTYFFNANYRVFNDAEGDYKTINKKIEIKMPGMSITDYGNIFRVLGDERFKYLMNALAILGVAEVTFAELTRELAEHDRQRSEFMRIAQDIEQISYDKNQNDLSNPRKKEFYTSWSGYDPSNDPEGEHAESGFAKRNHFGDLIELLQEYGYELYVTKEAKKETDENGEAKIVKIKINNETKTVYVDKSVKLSDYLNELRNAAAHNRYPNIEVFDKVLAEVIGKCESNKMPNIIQTIKTDMEKRIAETKTNTKSK